MLVSVCIKIIFLTLWITILYFKKAKYNDQRELMIKVFKHRLSIKMREETEINSGFTEENLLPTRLGSE